MLLSWLFVIVGLLLLAVGAEFLVRGSTSVAFRMGVTPLVVGLTIVAFGTGSPEFAVSIGSALEGDATLALGNVVGSNISNIALILGVAAMIRPLKARSEVVRRETPLMVLFSGFLWVLIYDGVLGRTDGLILTAAAVAYTVLTYRLSRGRQRNDVADEFADAFERPRRKMSFDVSLIALGLGTLVFGAWLLLRGAVAIAAGFGISEAVIGLTIVAVGTSLPELATSVMASRKGESDVALGNAIGSNVLNILAVLGVTAMIRPIPVDGVRTLDLGVMLGSAVVLNALLGRNFELDRLEGAALFAGYLIYLYSLVQ
jgi:cation:H+ antiporter